MQSQLLFSFGTIKKSQEPWKFHKNQVLKQVQKNREIFQVQIILLKYLYFNIFDFQDESMVNELVRVIGFAKTIILKKCLGH